jgi:hypothetical protein
MHQKPTSWPKTDINQETARILFLTYGQDAVEMAELRCRELKAAGDKSGLAGRKRVLRHVRELAVMNREERGTSH